MSSSDKTHSLIASPNVVASFREDLAGIDKLSVQAAINDSDVHTDLAAGVMVVPLSGDNHSQRLQLREILNLRSGILDTTIFDKIADGDKHRATLLRIADRARINHLTNVWANQRGIQAEASGSEVVTGKRLASIGNPAAWNQAVQFVSVTRDEPSLKQFLKGVRSVKKEWAKQLTQLNKSINSQLSDPPQVLGSTVPTSWYAGEERIEVPTGYAFTDNVADYISYYTVGNGSSGGGVPRDVRDVMRNEDDEKLDWDYTPSKSKPTGKLPVDLSSMMEETMEPGSGTIDDDLPPGFAFPTHKPNPNDWHDLATRGKSVFDFAELKIDESLRLTTEVRGYMSRKRRASTMGKTIAYPSRMIGDPERRIFGNKVKVKGGIVIIDISGSMSLSNEQIEAILESAPAATIMAYSHETGVANSTKPNAWILARRGWRVPNIPDGLGNIGNGVDGPALAWAVRHRRPGEPIVWICDGQVTGARDGFKPELAVMCAKYVKHHKIIMIPNVEQALMQFASGKFRNIPEGRVRNALLGAYGS
jgi:hypothetical protein